MQLESMTNAKLQSQSWQHPNINTLTSGMQSTTGSFDNFKHKIKMVPNSSTVIIKDVACTKCEHDTTWPEPYLYVSPLACTQIVAV